MAGAAEIEIRPTGAPKALVATDQPHAAEVFVDGSCCCGFERDLMWEFEEPSADEVGHIEQQQILARALGNWIERECQGSRMTVAIVWDGREGDPFDVVETTGVGRLADPETFYDVLFKSRRFLFDVGA